MSNFILVSLINKKEIRNIFNIFEKEEKEIQLVGGCVRDTLLGKETNDIDLATNAKPDEIINILKKNKIKYKDFAYRYGSIFISLGSYKFQITTLRKDIKQTGRDTEIIFTDNWKEDAQRRDFTINAIYLSSDGKINDYFNGIADIKEKKIIFIGKIEKRIQEDYLRFFRYFRFLGLFHKTKIDKNYETILNKYNSEVFNYLSNNIIRNEVLKMFKMPFSFNCFFQNFKTMERRQWLMFTKARFIKADYNLGLNQCLNKIDLIVN